MSARRWSVVVAALALVHLAAGAALEAGWFFSKYPDAVALLARGALDGDAAADFSVGYLWLNTVAPPLVIRWLQSLAGALAVVAVARLARRMAGRRSALVAAAVMAAHPTVLAYEATLEPDLLIAAFTLIALELLVRSRRRAGLTAAAFSLLGAAAALRPTGWVFLALGVAVAVRSARRSGAWPALAGGVALGVVLAVAPIAWRTRIIGGEVSATMSVGQVAYVGHRPEGTGVGAVSPSALKQLELQLVSPDKPDFAHVLFRRFAQVAERGGGAAAEGYWLGRVAAFAREEPVGFLRNLLRKASWFLAGPTAHDITGVRAMEERVRAVLHLDPSLLAIFGLAGLLLRARRRTGRVLLAGEALWLGLALVFYVTGRYSLPALVLLSPGLGPLAHALTHPKRLERAAWVPAGVSVLLLVAWWSHHRVFDPLLAAGVEGRVGVTAFVEARRGGDEARARAAWVDAVGAQPFLLVTSDLVGFPPDAPALAFAAGAARARRLEGESEIEQVLLAQLAVDAGRCDDARPVLAELERGPVWTIFDLPVAAWPLQVTCALRAGHVEDAAAAVDRALEERPGALFALAHALAAERALPGRRGAVLQKLLALHDPVSISWALTHAALTWGDLELAAEHSAALVSQLPDGGLAWALRARVLALRGDDVGALEALERACRLTPRQVFAMAPFDALLARALGDDAPPERWSLAGEVSFRNGRWAEARERWRRAEALWGGQVPPWHRAWVARFGGTRP